MGAKASMLSSLIIGSRGVKRLRGTDQLTPRGYIPVCVGVNDDTKRFIVHRRALTDAQFSELLYRSAEEYGFCNEGILKIPYEAKDFEEWMISWTKRKIPRVKSAVKPLVSE
ncbi:hypothetical protein L1049_004225 [Liquidambar formosana]|uniref:Small auxin up regulated protein n=1 Tax=Liquidambar formosana TaxID=63359 RepID=A0AAP0RTH3_LIQFO